MGIKRFAVAAALTAALAAGASAQWRETAAQVLSEGGDFRALGASIEIAYSDLPQEERPEAAAVAAYCAKKTGETQAETRWIIEFFESGRSENAEFVFLDFIGQRNVETYLNPWRAKYPWIKEVALIRGTRDEIIIPAGTLPLAVEITAPAFYKFFEGDKVLKAGAFQPGFNVLGLDANALFRESRRRTYFLEVKSGPLILKKPLILDVTVSWPEDPKPKPPEAPKVGKLARALGTPDPPPPPLPPKVRDYRLALYIGGDLLLSSQKRETVKPLELGVKPSKDAQFLKPDWNIKRNDPWANPGLNSQFSILDAIGLVGGLLKDLFLKKKSGDPEAARIQTVQDLSLDFKLRNADGRPLEMRVVMKLDSGARSVAQNKAGTGR